METHLSLQKHPVAIIGMSGIFACSQNVDAFWENIVAQANCITEVPSSRWDIADYYDPDPKMPDKTYSKVGGFLPDIDFDPLEYGLPPNILEVTDSSQILSLVMTKQALQDAKYEGKRFTEQLRKNTGVILGVGGGQKLLGPLNSRLQYPIWRKVLSQYGLSEGAIEEAVEKMKSAYISWQENAFPGFLGNVIAGRIANRFDLGGTNCVVDAACAASLSAIKMSINELVENRCDMMITGGVDTDNSPMAYLSFSKTPAFSKKNQSRPFDAEADGIVIGEGIGMLVMRRLADAERDGDTIYAVIKGIGSSSDGRHSSIYGPVSQGQQLAMQRAYQEAGYAPSTVGLLEAHGTGTPTGDRVEFHSISSVFKDLNAPDKKIALGSVKSQIGHTKTAAGAASLIKTSLALHHKVLPPTINVIQPNPDFNIEASPFYLNTQLRPWIQSKSDTPRRASVSAFGFGGTNFHLTLEEYQAEHQQPYRRWSPFHTAILHANDHETLKQRCQQVLSEIQKSDTLAPLPVPQSIPQHAPRLGFVYQSRTDLLEQLTTSLHLLQQSDPQKAWEHPKGISYSPQGMAPESKVAVLFSGQGSQYVSMGSDLSCLYPEFRVNFQRADRIMQAMYHETLSDKVFPIPSFDEATLQTQQNMLTQTQYAQPAIGVISMSMYNLLNRAGFQPSMVGGHSFGELTALWATGVLNEEDYLKLACLRGQVMAQAAKGEDAGGMLAVQADTDTVLKIISEQQLNLDLSNINAPDQVVLGGAIADIERASAVFSAYKLYSKVLPVSAAFHTLRLKEAQQPLADAISDTLFHDPQHTVFSNIDGQGYASVGSAIQQKFKDHMLSTVQFQKQIENMYQAGARIFVEIGPRNILSKLVQSTLKNCTYKVVALNANPSLDSAQQYQQALTQLLIAGVSLNVQDFYQLAPYQHEASKPKMKVRINASNYVSAKTQTQWEQALQGSSHKVSEPPKENIQAKKLNKMSNVVSNGQAPSSVKKAETSSAPPLKVIKPEQLPLQIIQKQIRLMEEMLKFHVQQQEALEKHRSFLKTYEHQINQMFSEERQNGKEAVDSSVQATVVVPELSEGLTSLVSNGNGHHPSNVVPEAQVEKSETVTPALDDQSDKHEKNSIFESAVLSLIADKTGYPAEMLSLDMELVADLGIDSIKQVEIFGAMREQYPILQQWQTEDFVQIKTLGDIMAKVNEHVVSPVQTAAAPQPASVSVEFPVEKNTNDEDKQENSHDHSAFETQVHTELATLRSAPQPILETDAVIETLLTVIADKTGYPAEMLSLDMELVADLGIDSIKQVEIFGAMREQYPMLHEVEPEQLIILKTISDIIALIQSGTKKKKSDDTVVPVQQASLPVKTEFLYSIPQQRVRLKTLPHPFQWERSWPKDGLALLTDDGTHVTNQLAQALIQRGLRVVVLRLPGIDSKKQEHVTVLSLEHISDETILHTIEQVQQQGSIQLFVHLHPTGQEREDIAQAVFWMAKYLQPIFHKQPLERCSFLAAISLNGALGYGSVTTFDWQAGGLSGIIKSLNREWPTVFCRAVDLHPVLTPQQVVDCLLIELQDTDLGLAEVGYNADLSRNTLITENINASQIRTSQIDLQLSDVVVVTGGARGITAECTIALAQTCPCTFILIGRTVYHEKEPDWADGITEEKALKQAIFQSLQLFGETPRPIMVQKVYQQITSSRSIKKTLAAIHEAGGNAVYLKADITDAAAIRQELSALQATWGKITGVIHGAGALADKLIEKKTEADFVKVYGTKVHGLLNVISAVDATQLKHLVLFSSISGFYGNEGQADYALANDTLNKWAISYQQQYPETKVTAINWGPWKTGMVTEYIQQEFQQRGVMLIEESEGVTHFLDLLSHDGSECVVVVNNRIPAPKKVFPLNNQTLRIQKRVKREENPFLEHHVIAGYPVMPFVTGIAWIANAAEQLFPSYHLVQCEHSKLFNGIIFNGKQASEYFLDLQVTQQDKQVIRLTGKVWSFDAQERRRYHYGSEVLLSTLSPEQPIRELPNFSDQPLKTRDMLYEEGSLFHGSAYQGMEALWHIDEQELWYTCRLPEPDEWMQGQFPLQTSKTFTTDAMCQGFLVWAYHHFKSSCLPAGMRSLYVYEPLPFDETFWVHLRITEQQGHRIVGSATAINQQGKVLVEAEDIALTVSEELLALYQKTIPTDVLAVVDMDIHLPGIQDLNAFHRAVYDGTLSASLSREPQESQASSISLYQKMRKKTDDGKPLAVVSFDEKMTSTDNELSDENSMIVSTFSEALTTAQSWLQKYPEGSVLVGVRHAISHSEAIIQLMLSSEARKTKQSVYAVLNNIQSLSSSTFDPLMPVLSYLDIDPDISPDQLSLTNCADRDVPTCALGTLSLSYVPLQDLARLIKVTLCFHYRFLPALPEPQSISQLSDWDAQQFYAPEHSFPWIPENKDEKRIAAMCFADAQSTTTFLQMQEAEPPASKSLAYLRQQDRKLMLVSGNDLSSLQAALAKLADDSASFSHQWAEELYRQYQTQRGKYTVSLIADSQDQLLREIANAQKGVEAAFAGRKIWQTPAGSYFSAEPLGKTAKIGFVYPGLASAYVGMIKDSTQLFPHHFDYYSSKIDQLHEVVHQPLMHPRYLQRPNLAERKAREALFLNNTVAAAESSISMSVFATHILREEFKLQPEAALGYSMGGITMFFAMEVWGFKHLRDRVRQSPVFQPDPVFEYWTHWVLNAPAEEVKQQISGSENLYLTFINTPENVIISGDRSEGEAWLQRHKYEGMMVDLYNVAHCPPVNAMYQTLQQMHLLEVEQTPNVRFYSGVTQEVLPLDKTSLAKNAADTYCHPVNFVSQVRKAYQDGINVFIEVGPKAWCSRLVGDILQQEPHISLSINQKGVSDYRSLLQLSSVLCSHGVPVHLPFYEVSSSTHSVLSEASAEEAVPVLNKTDNQGVTVPQSIVKAPSGSVRQQEDIIRLEEGGSVFQALNQTCYLYQDRDTNYHISASGFHNSQYKLVGYLPALPAEKLGNAAFLAAHKVNYAYMAGAMANGIASEEMVIALGQQGLLGSFGAAGLSLERVEKAIIRIQEVLPQGPYAFNLIHTPGDGALEMRLVEMYLRYKVRTLEASAFMELTPALVYYRAAGLIKDVDGNILAQNKIIAKISRSEVARLFMQPAPDALLEVLVMQGKITPEQMQWAKGFPMADDITVEADSGGHTDQQPLVCALPEMIRLKERIQQQHSYPAPLRIGAAGGISTPASIVAAFALGADYVVAGSINQSCVEAGTSLKVKELLAKASSVDVVLAPSADMFEMGVSVQVLKRGTLYANRARKLYQIYMQYESLSDIPAQELEKLEKQMFQKSVSEVWSDVETFFQQNDPLRLEAARQYPKKKMALIFRWYLGLSSKWAVKGEKDRAMDYQIWCGPSMGAFNDWVKGSHMEAIENRKVAEVAKRLLQEASLHQRIQLLKLYGAATSVSLQNYFETEMLIHV